MILNLKIRDLGYCFRYTTYTESSLFIYLLLFTLILDLFKLSSILLYKLTKKTYK